MDGVEDANIVDPLTRSEDVSVLKAVCQNLMHANLSVTDGVYGILSETDVREQINTLGNRITQEDNEDIIMLIELLK